MKKQTVDFGVLGEWSISTLNNMVSIRGVGGIIAADVKVIELLYKQKIKECHKEIKILRGINYDKIWIFSIPEDMSSKVKDIKRLDMLYRVFDEYRKYKDNIEKIGLDYKKYRKFCADEYGAHTW